MGTLLNKIKNCLRQLSFVFCRSLDDIRQLNYRDAYQITLQLYSTDVDNGII